MLLSFAKICHVVILTYGENIAGIDVHVWMEKRLYCDSPRGVPRRLKKIRRLLGAGLIY